MSRRSITAVGIGIFVAFFPLHAAITAADAVRPSRMMFAERFNGVSLGERADGSCGAGPNSWPECGSHVLARQGFYLCLGHASIEPCLNEGAARLVQRELRVQHVKERRRAERVAALLYTEVFLGGLDRGQLDLHALLGGAERAEVLGELLLRGEPRVAEVRLRVVLSDARPNDLLFASPLIEEREAEIDAHGLGVRERAVAPSKAVVEPVTAALEAQPDRRQVR